MTEKKNSGLPEQSAVPDKDPDTPETQGKSENPKESLNAPQGQSGMSDQQRAEQEERRTRQEAQETDAASGDFTADQKPEPMVDKGTANRRFYETFIAFSQWKFFVYKILFLHFIIICNPVRIGMQPCFLSLPSKLMNYLLCRSVNQIFCDEYLARGKVMVTRH